MNNSNFKKDKPKKRFNNASENGNRSRPSNSNGKPGFKKDRRARPKKAKQVSNLDPNLLSRKAVQTEVKDFRAERTIDDLPINNKLKVLLTAKGFERPSEIQDKTLESLLEGRDLLGIAQQNNDQF